MNLLVTGGAGFVGSHFIEHVIDRTEVRRLVNLDCLTYAGRPENLAAVARHPKYAFVRVDLRDAAAVQDTVQRHAITHVVHLAAESHVDRSIAGPADFVQSNVVGTFHLLEACRAAWPLGGPAARFVHVSTDEVYGSLGDTGAFTESSPYAPNSPYAASKAAADHFVRAWQRTYGLPVILTHAVNNFGPRQFPEKLIPLTLQRLIERQPVPVYGNGLNRRDWLYVRDHAEALWRVLQEGRLGGIYHIAAGNEWLNLRLVERLCDLVDELAPHLGGQSRKLISFVADRPGHDLRYALEGTRLREELGWKPAAPFESALRETVRWFLDQAKRERA